jgi:hypothetical protein
MTVAVCSNANADIYSTDLGYSLSTVPGMGSVTVTSYSEFIASCPTTGNGCTGTLGEGSTGPTNFSSDTQIAWLGTNTDWNVTGAAVTQVASYPNGDGPTSLTVTGDASSIWVVHGDSWYLAFLFANPISSFTIAGLPNAISFISAVTPLPPALILFGTALVGTVLLGRRRKARSTADVAASSAFA